MFAAARQFALVSFLINVFLLAGLPSYGVAQESPAPAEPEPAAGQTSSAGDATDSVDADDSPSEDGGDLSVEEITADISQAWATVDRLVDGFFALLPKLVIGLAVLILFWIIAWIVRGVISWYTSSSQSLGEVLGRLIQWIVLLVGVLVAMAIVAPSITPAKLLGALGIGGVAIGFAFKDLLQNFMAGLLILIRQPFRVGDQVVLGDHEGTVEQIDTRSTVIKTYHGVRVLIPNGQVYTNPMTVLTAYDKQRSQYDVGIGYADSIALARDEILEAIRGVDDVLTEPAPEVLIVDLAESTINLRARWWTGSKRAEVVHTNSRVMEAIKQRMDDAAIDMPYPTQVMLFHDQTEETDGDRKRQREGWPAGDSPPKAARALTQNASE